MPSQSQGGHSLHGQPARLHPCDLHMHTPAHTLLRDLSDSENVEQGGGREVRGEREVMEEGDKGEDGTEDI